jgi:hypothetical protein
MKSAKIKPNNLLNLYSGNEEEIQDKKLVEDLRNRLNELISDNLENQKKAAIILSSWINKKSKK